MVRVPIHMLFLCPEGGYSHCGPGLCKGHAAYRVPHHTSSTLRHRVRKRLPTPGRRFRAGLGVRDRMPVFWRHQQACDAVQYTVAGWALAASLRPNAIRNWRGHLPTSVAGHTRVLPRLDGASGRDWGTCRWGACFWGHQQTGGAVYHTVLALGAGRFPSPQWPAAVSAKGAATYIRLPSPVPALGRTSTCIASRKAAALRPKARGLALLPSPPQR